MQHTIAVEVFPHGFRCEDVGIGTRHIGYETAIETLKDVGSEGVAHSTLGTAAVLVGCLCYEAVECLGVGSCDVFHIVGSLQTAFNLKRSGSCLYERLQVEELAVVLQ